MESWDLLRTLWYLIIGMLLVGYSILDGFDLGIGVLMRFLARKEEEKKALFRAIGPFWDGNEVWLITGGAALFAAFPHAYATVFSGFYLALMLVLFALIFRAVSIEFWAHDEARRRLWEWAFIIGSFLPALLYGVALGNVMVGVPLNEKMDFTGSFFTLLRPYPLVIGVFGLVAILLHGASYAVMKSEGAIRERARKVAGLLLALFVIMLVVTGILTALSIPGALKSPLAWLAGLVVVCALVVHKISTRRGEDTKAFYAPCFAFLGLWAIVGAIHYPNLVKASNNSALSLTIYNASSSELTLTVMLVIALIGMPVVIAYSAYVHNIFKGKVSLEEKGY
jgi:cytochrome d ubiquinol oxidase subunit II